ncbi:MAG: DUF362 domain-containing protein [Syntrophomonadaceae bacterium]
MPQDLILRKGRLSSSLTKEMLKHADSGYADWRRASWQDNPSIMIFKAWRGGEMLGWLVYDAGRSTIEELMISDEAAEKDVLDQLVGRESLLAVELPETRAELIKRLIDYGFRPIQRRSGQGFELARLELSSAVLLNKLAAGLPATSKNSPARVVIERVDETQSDKEIARSLKLLIKKLGGIRRYVKPGQTVVIKPNIVSDHGLKDGAYNGGVVTDIRLIVALVDILLPVAGQIIIAEGSSINRSETSKLFSLYGYDKLAETANGKVRLVDLNNDELVEKEVPRGKRMFSRKIPVTLEQADVFINVPVMKIHFAARVSLCIKSLQGTVPPLEKYMTHFFGLWQNLVNIHHLLKPQLWIIDGITAQEDFGPLSGTPKPMNLLLGGTNPVAIDAVCMRIMGMRPEDSPPVWLAHLQGFGPIDPADIDIVGPSIEELRDAFIQPRLNLSSGQEFIIHEGNACPGCRGYLHFGLAKLRKSDPTAPDRKLIDRTFTKKVNLYLGPETAHDINPDETNLFMGLCQQHHAADGLHMPGCPPHSEVILSTLYSLFPDIKRPNYADKSEEAKLGEMLDEILAMLNNAQTAP